LDYLSIFLTSPKQPPFDARAKNRLAEPVAPKPGEGGNNYLTIPQ
jgi:hypothetical protein